MADSDFFEIDFLAVETAKSGDAITIRYSVNDITYVHVVDGGFTDTGKQIVNHINEYYGENTFIDHVVLTHSDRDHALGLKYVLENATVGKLWMNRPWLYAEELIDRFATYNSVDALRSRLKKCYPTVVDLEAIADDQGIEIAEVFQGTWIGHFKVMSPSKATYLDLIVESEKTPEGIKDEDKSVSDFLREALAKAASNLRNLVASVWGSEIFSPNETSAENEMSVVQFAYLSDEKILLTGDTGRRGLAAVIDYAPHAGLTLPGIDRFQVPHHGSRRNVSTELLDAILGKRIAERPANAPADFHALISSALEDEHHPRPAVERAMQHRGGVVIATEGVSKSSHKNAPQRTGWSAATPRPYPEQQDE